MSTSRSELHDLVDELPDDQVAAVVEDLRRRARPRPRRTSEPFSWIGMATSKDGVTDLATNPEHLKGFGHSSL